MSRYVGKYDGIRRGYLKRLNNSIKINTSVVSSPKTVLHQIHKLGVDLAHKHYVFPNRPFDKPTDKPEFNINNTYSDPVIIRVLINNIKVEDIRFKFKIHRGYGYYKS